MKGWIKTMEHRTLWEGSVKATDWIVSNGPQILIYMETHTKINVSHYMKNGKELCCPYSTTLSCSHINSSFFIEILKVWKLYIRVRWLDALFCGSDLMFPKYCLLENHENLVVCLGLINSWLNTMKSSFILTSVLLLESADNKATNFQATLKHTPFVMVPVLNHCCPVLTVCGPTVL